jgi:streptogrisin C
MRQRVLATIAMLSLVTGAPVAQAVDDVRGEQIHIRDIPDVPAPRIDDPVSDAELDDLSFLAEQKGISLEAAIARYAWNDNFALAVSSIRDASPRALAGAEIVDDGRAWVAFEAGAPNSALDVIETFEKSHGTIAVDVRTDLGFNEVDVEQAVATVHYAALSSAGVDDATTTFDFDAREITTVVAIGEDAGPTAEGIRALGGLLDSITISIVRSHAPALGSNDDNAFHIGGEDITACTTGFVVQTPQLIRGVGTAGHCDNAQVDDGVGMVHQLGHQGVHGDFQWNRGPQGEPDDFYSGDADTLEVLRRDVAAMAAPVVGQPLCKNGATNFKDCQDVAALGLCKGAVCNLVRMESRLAAGGDSGGSVYWANTAYGFHQGSICHPVCPFVADVFSRADRIDNALGVTVAVGG